MQLNLGCGRNKRDGFVNVDSAPACAPDELWDLEQTPWPWPDNSVEEALFHHSLEHMGADPKVFIRIMQELYRVCAPQASVTIVVPHPRHDSFLSDPTHVRAILPDTLRLFDRQLNEHWAEIRAANTPLALYAGVDFQLENTHFVVTEPYLAKVQSGELSHEAFVVIANERNNVVREIRMTLRVRKG